MVRFPTIESWSLGAVLLAGLAVTFAGCRAVCPADRIPDNAESVGRAIRCCPGPDGRLVVAVSPVQLSTNCQNVRELSAALESHITAYLSGATRYSVCAGGLKTENVGIGAWLSVMRRPHFNELGGGVAFDCRVICGVREGAGEAEPLADYPFVVERDAPDGVCGGEVGEGVVREIAVEVAKKIGAALDRRIPFCGRVIFRRSTDSFVVNRGVGDGLRDGDEFVLVARNAAGRYPVVASAVVKPESGRGVLEVKRWFRGDSLDGVAFPRSVPREAGVYAILLKDLT